MFKRLFFLFCAGFLAPVTPQVSAQQANHPVRASRVPVTIALVKEVPNTDQPFVVQRRPDQTPADIIVLRADATADQLSEAISALTIIRQAHGDFPVTAGTVRIRPQGNRPHRQYPWVPRVLADLRRAPERELPQLGSVRSVQIWLPRTH